MEYKLILGLGNPDPEFLNTYHNVGVLAVLAIAAHLENSDEPPRFKRHGDVFEYAKMPGGEIVIRPLVFMNESGRAAKEALRSFSAKPNELLVIHDDSDIQIGEYKLSTGQGAAGHRGVESIIAAIGSNDFARIRIGIRAADESRRKKASEFVLSPISKKDKKIFDEVFETITEKLKTS
jgi:peptidyl-tRNA hydrolase, PTH1 family